MSATALMAVKKWGVSVLVFVRVQDLGFNDLGVDPIRPHMQCSRL